MHVYYFLCFIYFCVYEIYDSLKGFGKIKRVSGNEHDEPSI